MKKDLIKVILVFIVLVFAIWFFAGCDEVYNALDPNRQPPEKTATEQTQTFPNGPEYRN